MATDLGELITALNIETGGQLTEAQLVDLAKTAVDTFNANATNIFTREGTLLDRDASAIEKRAIVLWGAILYLDQLTIEWSLKAIVHSNVAGRTKLDGIEFALGKRRKELMEQQLTPLMQSLASDGISSEVHAEELGETKDIDTILRQYPYVYLRP